MKKGIKFERDEKKPRDSLADFILIILCFVIFILTINSMLVTSHEEAHKQACRLGGGSASIEYNKFFFFKTGGHTDCLITGESGNFSEIDRYYIQNEMIAYNVSNISMAVLFGAFLISLTLLVRSPYPQSLI